MLPIGLPLRNLSYLGSAEAVEGEDCEAGSDVFEGGWVVELDKFFSEWQFVGRRLAVAGVAGVDEFVVGVFYGRGGMDEGEVECCGDQA